MGFNSAFKGLSNIYDRKHEINPLNAELNPICRLLALLGAHHILHISRIRVNTVFVINVFFGGGGERVLIIFHLPCSSNSDSDSPRLCFVPC